jgi:hypothetical protein
MFCPQCRAEYVEGITECSDCHIPLVVELSEPDHAAHNPYKEILSTYNQGDIALIKSILDGAGIDYYFRTEFFNQMEPLIQPAMLVVRKNQIQIVQDLLKDLNLTFLGVGGSAD